MRPVARSLATIVLALVVLQPAEASAAPGQLDTAFGNGGIALAAAAPSGAEVADMALAPDGKIVVAGTYTYYPSPPPSFERREDFFVARFLSTGALDTTFSGDGVVTTSIDVLDQIHGVAVQADGKIVVVGSTRGAVYLVKKLTIARYTSSGALDTTFDGDGHDMPQPDFVDGGEFHDVVIGPDGMIYATGTAYGSGFGFVVFKYAPTGGIETYGDKGWGANVSFGGSQQEARAIALQADGKVVLTGLAEIGDTGAFDFGVARLTSAGLLDTTFSSDGKVTTHVGSQDAGLGVAVAPDGRVVVTGTRAQFGSESGDDFTVLRYTSAGVLDTTFDRDGKVTNVFGSTSYSVSQDVTVQADGKIVAGGTRNGSDVHLPDIAVARFTVAGALDTTFGVQGIAQTDTDNYERASAVAIQTDGKILAAGSAGGPAVVRYQGDTVTPPPPPPGTTVSVADFSFRPATVKATAGQTVTWQFNGPSSHTASDKTGMGLFDSGAKGVGTTFSYTYTAAGGYAFQCLIHPTSTMPAGKVQVPVTITPASGTTASAFTVSWASAVASPGYLYDVQIKRPGTAGYVTWKSGVTMASATFTPDGGAGT